MQNSAEIHLYFPDNEALYTYINSYMFDYIIYSNATTLVGNFACQIMELGSGFSHRQKVSPSNVNQ